MNEIEIERRGRERQTVIVIYIAFDIVKEMERVRRQSEETE